LVGTKEIEIRRLPSLDVAWRYPVGKSPVRQLAAMETFVAYVASGSFDVRLVRKPAPGASGATHDTTPGVVAPR
jgi:hypothetical protein